jgi:hypothetical protein
MDDIHVAAAVLTLALHSAGHEQPSKTGAGTGEAYGRTTRSSYKNYQKTTRQSTNAESIRIDCASELV